MRRSRITGVAAVVLGMAAFALLASNGFATHLLGSGPDEPSSPESAYRDAVMADAPISYWRLGELSGATAFDATDLNPGTYQNGVTRGLPGAVRNSINTASQLDGVDDVIQVPDSNTLDRSTAVTIEAWVKRTATQFAPVAGKPANGQSKFENYSIWLTGSNRAIAYFGNGQNFVSVTGGNALDTNWHHIVATADNTTARLYLDGSLLQSKAMTVTLTPNANPLNIGRSSAATTALPARIDEVAVYPTVLSAARILAHYQAARSDTVAPLPTLDTPSSGTATNDTTPTYSGTGGVAGGDTTTMTVKVYSGPNPTGTPVQVRTTTLSGGNYTVDGSPALGEGTFTARTEQADEVGNVGYSLPTTFTIDVTAPAATITSNPPNPSNATSGSFSFTSNEGGSTFRCSLDGAPFATCTSPNPYSGLTNGGHNFQVKAVDPAGNTGAPASYSWTVDTVAPTATITSGPESPTNDQDATFTFTANEGGSTFRCSLDGGPFSTCTSPQSYLGNSDGDHTFDVKAVDPAGNTGAADGHSWTVDTADPTIDLANPPDDSTTNDTTPTFSGTAGTAPGDSTTVTVKVYDGPTPTGTPVETLVTSRDAAGHYSVDATDGLVEGTYTGRSEQGDAAGNTGLSNANTFVIDTGGADTTPPTVTLVTPASGSATNDTTPAFAGTAGTDPGDLPEVTVKLYEGTEATGDPLQTLVTTAEVDGSYTVGVLSALVEGTYTAKAQQDDEDSNRGFSPARTFDVDVTPPTVTITGSPPNPSSSSSATFTFTANEAGSVFTCSIDGGAFTACSSGQTYTNLAEGPHDFEVEPVDRAGNVGATDSYSWTIDLTAPIATITSAPADPSNSTSASFSFTSNESGSTFLCSLDGAAFSACSSPQSYSDLTSGSHTFRVKSVDQAGNVGPTAMYGWAVDTVAPTVTLAAPANGSSTAAPKPTFSGSAGVLFGDSTTVTVKIYLGTDTSGTLVQTLTTTRTGSSYSVRATAPLSAAVYTARAQQLDTAGNIGFSAANTFTITDPVILAAGDIASCEGDDGDDETAALLDSVPDAEVLSLGDHAYVDNSATDFANCYDPTWGRAKARTHPTVGNHEYTTPGASGYFNYWGAAAGTPGQGWYSWDLGSWHMIALNANCAEIGGCQLGSAEEAWLRADLAAHPASCVLAYMHQSRFSSGGVHGSDTRFQPFWQALYDYGADVVLSAHDHLYERFAPQTPAGVADPAFGIREILTGTGGYYFYPFGTIQPNSEARSTGTYGVLKMTLRPNSYDWQFLPQAGGSFTDSGTGTCHGTPGPPPPPPPPPPTPPPPPPPPPSSNAPNVRSVSAGFANASTSITFSAPTGTQTNDVLVAIIAHQNGSNRNLVPPAGWSAVPNGDWADGTNARIRSYYKVAGALEPPSYTFSFASGTGQDMSGGILAISDASPFAPINASNGQFNGAVSSKNVTAPSITTTVPDTLLVFGGACNVIATFTPPTGMFERWDVASAGAQYRVSTEAATQGLGSAGATGTRVALASTSCRNVAVAIAVAPD